MKLPPGLLGLAILVGVSLGFAATAPAQDNGSPISRAQAATIDYGNDAAAQLYGQTFFGAAFGEGFHLVSYEKE